MADNAAGRFADALTRELQRRADLYGWSPVPNEQLTRSGDRGLGSLLAALPDTPSASRLESRLPEFRCAFDLVPTSMSILLCNLSDSAPDDSYRAALWWAGLVRSDLSPPRRSDLHLLLIAPPGSVEKPEWRARRSKIESDVRFCRKFVWLPSADPNESEVATFFDRTFLAQPWRSAGAEPRSLDPVERLVQETGAKRSLSADEARKWIARLGTLEAGGAQRIAEDLVRILEESSG